MNKAIDFILLLPKSYMIVVVMILP